CDLLHGEPLAALERGGEIAGGLLGGALGLGAALRHDLLRFLERVALLSLVVRQHPLRFLAQPLRLVELRLDLEGAGIERGCDAGSRLIDESAYGDDEGDRDPELVAGDDLVQHYCRSRIARSMAAAACPASILAPVSLVAAASATSKATSRTLASAAVFA